MGLVEVRRMRKTWTYDVPMYGMMYGDTIAYMRLSTIALPPLAETISRTYLPVAS